jgi:hypothetical protein
MHRYPNIVDLPRGGTKQMVRAAPETILRRHALVGPDAGGWHAGPRT